MSVAEPQAVVPTPSPRWNRLTPDRCLGVLLVAEGLLFLAEQCRWLPKGWPVLITIAALIVMMLLMLMWFVVALVLRSHFQFGIRSLLVLTVAVAVPFSWLAVEMKKAREQEWVADEIAEIPRVAGQPVVLFDWQFDASGFVEDAQPPGPRWLRELLGYHFLSDVVWESSVEFDDAKLEHLKGLTQLKVLILSGSRVTDAGLQYLTGLGQLQELYLQDTDLTDAGVTKLQQALPNCKITR